MPDGTSGSRLAPIQLLNQAISLAHAGQSETARDLMREVAVRLPDWDEPPLRLAGSLRGSPEAAAAWRAALAINPNRDQTLLGFAAVLMAAGQPREAIGPLLRCCGLTPNQHDAWRVLGQAYLDSDQPRHALGAFARAQAIRPNSFALVHSLVLAAIASGQAEREAARQIALSARDPLNPIPHLIHGLILDRLGLLDPAIDAIEAAVALAPDAREPIALLGGVLARTARARPAEAALRDALLLDPENPQLLNDRAAVLMRLHRHAEARDLLREVAHRNGPHSSVLCNLANATCCLGAQDEAVELARAAIALDPWAVLPRRSLANTMPYQDHVSGAALLKAARDCAALLPRGDLPPIEKPDRSGQKLTIGLLSGTLRTHPVGWLTVAGFEHLDQDQFDIVCLSRAPEQNDPISRRFHRVTRAWENVSALDDDALARRARALGIDILIDFGGHGDAARMAACARRLAPVQIKWVGMQNHSTGLPEMDWFLTDRWETPPGLESLYSERLLRLTDGYVCYSPPAHAPDVAPLPMLHNEFVTFGCFNNIAKITPRAIAAWCHILHAVPRSRLILKTHQFGDPPTVQRFQTHFTGHGIDASRVEMRGSSPHRAFLASYHEIDIVLDPFPYSGGLTTCEALWMGVPTVTLPGEIFASRHSASHLSNAGYPDWVARDLDDYIGLAIRKAADPNGLARLRAGMRAQTRASPLCDAPRFGQSLARALRHAWDAT